jgi:ABC-type polysaccharide/polyol phosphate transport system ATPase subunit
VTNVIEVSHVYKQYQPRGLKLRTLMQDISARVRKTELPTGTQPRSVLQDITFNIKQGESVGIIGSNGSGKTTLLRLLAGISLPTMGRVRVQGRVAPLLALGAGFHNELSGRENLYLNCTLMGLSYRKTLQTIDSIVEFAELGQYVDIAVKRYSSGMVARLGFAAAIHTEPDIILLDEVLAVGDHNFIVKSFAALRRFMGEGRTVILVSHGLSSIEEICTRAIWIEQSNLRADGPSAQIVDQYKTYQRQLSASKTAAITAATPENEVLKRVAAGVSLRRVQFDPSVEMSAPQVLNTNGVESRQFAPEDDMHVRCQFSFAAPRQDVNILIGLINLKTGTFVATGDSRVLETASSFSGAQGVECLFSNLHLLAGSYGVYVSVSNASSLVPLFQWHDLDTRFTVSGEPAPSDSATSPPQVTMRYLGSAIPEPAS